MRKGFLFSFSSFVFIVIVIGKLVIVAQDRIEGTWKADSRKQDDGKIHLSFERRTDRGGRNQHGSNFAFSDLQGLTADNSQNGRVTFRLAREAGTIDCEGSFANGVGSGTFVFTPNMGFADAMRSRGFDFTAPSKHGPKETMDRMFAATTLNVTTAFADSLLSANFGQLDVDDLFKAVIFKITPEFMSEMKASGFPNLGMEELVKARIFKIDGDYLRKVKEMGFADTEFESLVKFRIFKVTPEFLAELKNEGFSELSSEDVVKFRIFKIDTEFIRAARAEEPNITVEQLVQRRIGVRRR
ncbi:MAG TPA: hypothetical protein VJL58_02065 [Pyrinomonadaceae bacterium]|nr:hypothetical protein [Pyrinomonadaceae bacterium]